MALYDNMEFEKILSVVSLINDDLALSEGMDGDGDNLVLRIETDSSYFRIVSGDCVLWDTEDNCRKWVNDDNQEDLGKCLSRRTGKLARMTERLHVICARMFDQAVE